MVDDSLRRETSNTWHRFRDYRFGEKASANEEDALQARGLYSLEGYLHYWNDAINRVTKRIEPDRLLIVRTDEISSKVAQIAHFCGISADGVTPEETRSFVNPTRFGVLGELDPGYLTDKTEKFCGDNSRQLFPDCSIEYAVRKLRAD